MCYLKTGWNLGWNNLSWHNLDRNCWVFISQFDTAGFCILIRAIKYHYKQKKVWIQSYICICKDVFFHLFYHSASKKSGKSPIKWLQIVQNVLCVRVSVVSDTDTILHQTILKPQEPLMLRNPGFLSFPALRRLLRRRQWRKERWGKTLKPSRRQEPLEGR